MQIILQTLIASKSLSAMHPMYKHIIGHPRKDLLSVEYT